MKFKFECVEWTNWVKTLNGCLPRKLNSSSFPVLSILLLQREIVPFSVTIGVHAFFNVSCMFEHSSIHVIFTGMFQHFGVRWIEYTFINAEKNFR